MQLIDFTAMYHSLFIQLCGEIYVPNRSFIVITVIDIYVIISCKAKIKEINVTFIFKLKSNTK